MQIDFSQIKLIIWDLDDTFWTGTLSEGIVTPIPAYLQFVRLLTDCGVINTICSKNDKRLAEEKLRELGVLDYFVFNSIDWTPKGPRIQKLIKDMGLRSKNCLFLDDNVVNLNEAIFYEPDLMIAEPTFIPELVTYYRQQPVSDSTHKRLKSYQVLEKKLEAKSQASDNLDFLFSSNTHVEILHDCAAHIDRITELVNRTNQLNYTKIRSTKEEIVALIENPACETGYVKVWDNWGDYGIVGFYAVMDGRCLHFLFSCRTIGQGVEQYVYAILGHPQLVTVGEVVNPVTDEPAPAWINQRQEKKADLNTANSQVKVVFKGGCDLNIMSDYLNTSSIVKEFTYFGQKRKNNIEHYNNSVNYLSFPFLSEAEKKILLDDCIFNDEEMFHTAMYDDDVAIVFLSTMIEPNLGIYRNKENGNRIAWGEYLYPLTDPKNWDLYINNEIFTADNTFTREWLESFQRKYTFEGCLSPDEIMDNMERTLKKVNPNTKVCYLLGSETPYLKNKQPNYEERHLIYKAINDRLRAYAKFHDQVWLIDFNEFIQGQEDFTNNINHFQRRVYYEVATRANQYISILTGSKLQQKSRFYLFYKTLIDKIGYTGFYQSKLYGVLHIPYVFLRSLCRKKD